MLAATANAASPTLTLSVKSSAALTEATPIVIVVSNTTKTPLTLEDPRASTHASLHLVDTTTREDFSFSMGQPRTADFGPGQWALETPVVERVTLAAGQPLEVRADANERLFLRPGTFDVFFTLDDVQSNHVTLTVRFTASALERLITLAADPRASYARREWAMELIRRVKKDFTLSLPLPEATQTEREPLEAQNRVAVTSLRRWVSAQPASALAKQLEAVTR
ncbi:MAG: hypothetical protein ABTQ32_40135 [Myxococcaceae bacterium]